MQVALDTNLLAYARPRFLFAGICHAVGARLVVLPEVMRETRNRIFSIEERRIVKRFKDGGVGDGALHELAKAAGSASLAWLEEELGLNGNLYDVVTPTVGREMAARRVAANLPENSTVAERDEVEGDPLIIGEAIAYGVHLISTKNLRSISHDKINDWARRVGVLPPGQELLNTPDRTVLRLAKGSPDQAACWGASYSLARRVEDEVNWRDHLRRCGDSISDAGMKYLGLLMRWHGEGGAEAEALLLAELRQSRPLFETMIDAERLRQEGIATAVDERMADLGLMGAPRQGGMSP